MILIRAAFRSISEHDLPRKMAPNVRLGVTCSAK
jgi:hypothetical protein